MGGDEFVVILYETKTQTVVQEIGDRILQKIGMPMSCGTLDCNVGASIGAAIYPTHGKNEEAILNAADNAMYRAKRAGKNRIEFAGKF